jgi:hypothetical protein
LLTKKRAIGTVRYTVRTTLLSKSNAAIVKSLSAQCTKLSKYSATLRLVAA